MQKVVKAEEITWMVEGVYLPATVFVPAGHASHAFYQHRKVLARTNPAGDDFAAAYSSRDCH
jgi:hypothetical protein